ncbi:DUF5801 repeats-in-toxin domain-containing protein, partial [Sphingomicrobium nitratireducens]|uniref:DUF5801 repeats-in-toxin domain-containing protein n=1 Tax=Sphingomicrobium nitratireducens TaxID=2964666 RepID=UPI0022402966
MSNLGQGQDNENNEENENNEATEGRVPVVIRADAIILEPNADGVVVLPAEVSLGDIMVVGTDLVIEMPDGTQYVIPNGAVFVPQLVIGGIEVPPTNLAALLIGTEPQPAAGQTQSSGGNFAVPVPDLGPRQPLGDLLPPTEPNYTPPTLEPLALSVDNKPQILVGADDEPGQPGDPTNGFILVENAVTFVDEAGLPERNVPVEPEGTNAAADVETVYGVIVYNSPDTPNAIYINGVLVTGEAGQVIPGTYGDLTIISFNDGGDGEIQVSYTLRDNTSGDNTKDFFDIVIVDSNGDTDEATLTINIIDDEPIARDDYDSLTEDQTSTDGNVMSGAGTDSGAAGRDTVGADDAELGNPGTYNLKYGILVIDADGEYTYTLYTEEQNPAAYAAVQALASGEELEDTFLYDLEDGDGDIDQATLTISIIGTNGRPQVGSDSVVVGEEHIPVIGNPDDDPDNGPYEDMADSDSASGEVPYSDPDGDIVTVTLGAPAETYYSNGEPIDEWTFVGGVLTGSAGGVPIIRVTIDSVDSNSINYTVQILGPIDHPVEGVEDNLSVPDMEIVIPVSVSDGEFTVPGGSIIIDVEDDSPEAGNDGTAQFSLIVDESPTDEGSDGIESATTTPGAIAAQFDLGSFGADGGADEGSEVYTLELILGEGNESGLIASGFFALDPLDTYDGDDPSGPLDGIGQGDPIYLYKIGDTIYGSTALVAGDVDIDADLTDGNTYFTITIDDETGDITFTQTQNVWHEQYGDTPADYDDGETMDVTGGSLVVRKTLTDWDGDSDSADLDISDGLFTIEDDGPDAGDDPDPLNPEAPLLVLDETETDGESDD